MDRTMRVLLSLAIAILYPVVVYFAVVTVIPRPGASNYPTYPSCYRQYGSSYSSRYDYEDDASCDRQHREYDEKLKDYNAALKEDEGKNLVRAQLALGIALLTIAGALFLRDVKELMAGLTVGAMVVIVSAVTVLVATNSNDLAVGNVLLILISFIFLTTVLYLTERGLPERVPEKRPEPPVTPPGE
jgi:hypothetical protein